MVNSKWTEWRNSSSWLLNHSLGVWNLFQLAGWILTNPMDHPFVNQLMSFAVRWLPYCHYDAMWQLFTIIADLLTASPILCICRHGLDSTSTLVCVVWIAPWDIEGRNPWRPRMQEVTKVCMQYPDVYVGKATLEPKYKKLMSLTMCNWAVDFAFLDTAWLSCLASKITLKFENSVLCTDRYRREGKYTRMYTV